MSRGFTLLEVMVSLVIIATVLLFLQGVSNRSITSVEEAIAIRRARLLARAKMEEIVIGEEEGLSGGWEDAPGYEWSAQIEEVDVAETQKVRKVTLTVRYPIAEGETDEEPAEGEETPGRIVLETFIDPEEIPAPTGTGGPR